ncbi:MAG: 1-acyl-sn-glycerol-3-phosphate acyltransferase [Actinomycetota bacterium]|nr:1-acyl-sn-glycerol-3-phosphate acyltransferase [Actinomycetota bacterium]
MSVPPRMVRRIVFAPAMLLITFLVLTTVPAWGLFALAVSPLVPGKLRPLRVLWLVAVYLITESLGLLASFALWVASGFGALYRTERFETLHYRLLAWAVTFIYRNAVRVLKVSIEIEQVDEHDASPIESRRPLLVFCRHAGPGDSFLLLHEVIVRLGRRPRIVMKDLLQFDPMLDVVLNRLPNQFVASTPGSSKAMVRAVQTLAEDMDERDALVLFPEGSNFTPKRRLRAIERLRSLGHQDEASTASEMTRVLPPRPGGALAAIAANPQTDILLVAHTGLEHMSGPRDLWRGLPMDTPIKAAWWLEPEEDVPSDPDEQVDWLFANWKRIDSWISANEMGPDAEEGRQELPGSSSRGRRTRGSDNAGR